MHVSDCWYQYATGESESGLCGIKGGEAVCSDQVGTLYWTGTRMYDIGLGGGKVCCVMYNGYISRTEEREESFFGGDI
jgi:hypothetical protein